MVVALLGVATFLLLLALGRGLTFFADEWAVIAERTISVESFLEPFNEHWLGITIVVYRLMYGVVGLDSYLPYLALLAGLHLVVAGEVYLLARRSSSPVIAIGAAAILFVFGSGFENLYWGMQIGFIGAIALGLAALLLVDGSTSPARVVGAALLVTLSVMTSGLGLFMLALVTLDLLLDGHRRRLAVAMIVPGLIYGAWYLALGRSGVATTQDPFTVAALLGTPAFVFDGLAMAFGSVFGVGPVIGRAVLVAAVGAVVVQAARGRSIPARTLACFGAVIAEYAVIGLVRSGLDNGAADYTRYAYLSGTLLVIALTAWVGHPTVPEAPRLRVGIASSALALLTVSLTWNSHLLIEGRKVFAERADNTRATLVVALDELPAGLNPDRAKLLDRTVTRLRQVLTEAGAPFSDGLALDAVEPVDPALVTQVRDRLETAQPVPGS